MRESLLLLHLPVAMRQEGAGPYIGIQTLKHLRAASALVRGCCKYQTTMSLKMPDWSSRVVSLTPSWRQTSYGSTGYGRLDLRSEVPPAEQLQTRRSWEHASTFLNVSDRVLREAYEEHLVSLRWMRCLELPTWKAVPLCHATTSELSPHSPGMWPLQTLTSGKLRQWN